MQQNLINHRSSKLNVVCTLIAAVCHKVARTSFTQKEEMANSTLAQMQNQIERLMQSNQKLALDQATFKNAHAKEKCEMEERCAKLYISWMA